MESRGRGRFIFFGCVEGTIYLYRSGGVYVETFLLSVGIIGIILVILLVPPPPDSRRTRFLLFYISGKGGDIYRLTTTSRIKMVHEVFITKEQRGGSLLPINP